jgi:hypothetical protein
MRFGEEVMEKRPLSEPGDGEEVIREVLGTMRSVKE